MRTSARTEDINLINTRFSLIQGQLARGEYLVARMNLREVLPLTKNPCLIGLLSYTLAKLELRLERDRVALRRTAMQTSIQQAETRLLGLAAAFPGTPVSPSPEKAAAGAASLKAHGPFSPAGVPVLFSTEVTPPKASSMIHASAAEDLACAEQRLAELRSAGIIDFERARLRLSYYKSQLRRKELALAALKLTTGTLKANAPLSALQEQEIAAIKAEILRSETQMAEDAEARAREIRLAEAALLKAKMAIARADRAVTPPETINPLVQSMMKLSGIRRSFAPRLTGASTEAGGDKAISLRLFSPPKPPTTPPKPPSLSTVGLSISKGAVA